RFKGVSGFREAEESAASRSASGRREVSLSLWRITTSGIDSKRAVEETASNLGLRVGFLRPLVARTPGAGREGQTEHHRRDGQRDRDQAPEPGTPQTR
ncbi:hypothetical protein INR49_023729, partial [Caranx melampygus]